MLRLRRSSRELRIEIMPLIDVIFLLLTFFIYAMVLMVRAELLPMQLQEYGAAEPATPHPAATISIGLDGQVYFDRQPTAIADLRGHIEAARDENPQTVMYLALEEGDGTVDRGPIFTEIWDQLQDAGIDIYLVGRPKNQ